MSQKPQAPPLLFRILLRLYPREFRARYRDEMAAMVRQERAAAGSPWLFWLRQVADHVRAAWSVRARRRRRAWAGGGLRTLRDDVVHASRSLSRAPGFAAFAVLTLALGIGSTAAVFTVVDRVLLRPLPYPGSERMALVGVEARNDPGSVGPLSPALLAALRERPGPAEAVVAARVREAILEGTDGPERVDVTEVSRGFFDVFGARAGMGRLLRPEDHEPGAAPVVVVGHRFWQEELGGAADAVGRGLRLGDRVHTVVGVLPPGFQRPPEVAESAVLWAPLDVDWTVTSSFFLAGAVRLAQGTALSAWDDHSDAVMAGVYEGRMPRFLLGLHSEPYRDVVVGPVAGALGRVLAGVALLLVIACVNVAGLLLTRGAERRQELGVQVALGASRPRLLRKLLAESTLLAAGGGLLGAALAWGAVELFRVHGPASLPRLGEVSLDGRGLTFAVAVSAAAVLLFGLLPALRSTRRLGGGWRSGARGATAGPREGRLRTGLIVTETALAVVMAVGAGLLAHDLARISTEDTGFRPDGLVAVTVNLEPRYEQTEWAATWERLMAEADGVPGVSSVAVATQAPYDGARMVSTFRPEGQEAEDPAFLISVAVAGDYLDALGTRLLEGRPLDERDVGTDPGALVNQAFVDRYWPGTSGVGRLVRSGQDDEPTYRVVGVVEDVRIHPGQDVSPHVFVHLREAPWREMELLVRTSGDAAALAPGLRSAVRRVDPSLPITRIQTLEALTSRALATPRFYATLFGGFAGLAILLALVGVYGTTAFATRSRLREIGIRQALGARSRQVIGRLVARAAATLAAGVALGLIGAASASGLLAETLRHVEPRDAATYLAVAAGVMAVGVLAAWLPARAAGRVDPAHTLREQ